MSEHGALFLGVDGGGTTTRAVVVDADGVVRGRGVAGGANQEVIGSEAAAEAVRAAAQAAQEEAGAERPVRAAWIGLAGVDAPPDTEALRPALAPLADQIRITNDAELLLGALPGGVGVALIAGTGSIALGRNAAGETARAGGWGHIFGDEGSGYALGVAALRAAARAADGRSEPTALTPAVLHALDVATPDALIARVHQGCDKAGIARLASIVVAAAESGDAVGLAILRRAADDLAEQARAVVRALSLGKPLLLALGGGLLLEAQPFRALLLGALAGAGSSPPSPPDQRGEGVPDDPTAVPGLQPALAQVILVRDAALAAARSMATEAL